MRPQGHDSRVAGQRSESVGERLKRLRGERGLSQRDLSSQGVSYAYISRIEAGARRPSVKALRKLAEKLGVSAEYLETGAEIGDAETRELRLVDLELRLRLDGEAPTAELEELLAEANAKADDNIAARVHVALGGAAATEGHHTAAIEHLERAVAYDFITPVSRPEIFLSLARAYATAGTPGRAVELLEGALAEVKAVAPEDSATRVRFRT